MREYCYYTPTIRLILFRCGRVDSEVGLVEPIESCCGLQSNRKVAAGLRRGPLVQALQDP